MTGASDTPLNSQQNFVEERLRKRELQEFKTIGVSSLLLTNLLLPFNLLTFCSVTLLTWLLFVNLEELSDRAGRYKRAQRGEEAEFKIASLVQENFKKPNTHVYSILNENRLFAEGLGDLDVTLVLPSGKIFAISVKSLFSKEGQPIKVFYDLAVNTIRYRKGRKGKVNFERDPIQDSRQRVQWLLHNRKDVINRIPVEILVFADPVEVYLHEKTPTKKVGNKDYLKHEGVYVVAQKDLVQLIKDLSEDKKTHNKQRFKHKPKEQQKSKPPQQKPKNQVS